MVEQIMFANNIEKILKKQGKTDKWLCQQMKYKCYRVFYWMIKQKIKFRSDQFSHIALILGVPYSALGVDEHTPFTEDELEFF